MTNYCYEIYYSYDGPSHSQPFAKQKSDIQIRESLSDFRGIVCPYLYDHDSKVNVESVEGKEDRIKFILKTEDSEESVENAIIKACQLLDLRAQRI